MPKKKARKPVKALVATHEMEFFSFIINVGGKDYEYFAPTLVECDGLDEAAFSQEVLYREPTDLDDEELKCPSKKDKASGSSFVTR